MGIFPPANARSRKLEDVILPSMKLAAKVSGAVMSVSLTSRQMEKQYRANGSVDARIGFALICLLLGISVWIRLQLPMNTDTSWLMTVSDMMLDGKKLYVDVSETNPPASVWIYLPIVALARLLNVAAEPLVNAWIFALFAVSAGLSAMILARAGWLQRYDRFILAACAIAILTILPGNTFSEREHVATLLCLPFLAATIARMHARSLSWPLLVAAGLCGGIVVSIKPHFILGLELPVLAALRVRRRWTTLFSTENIVAGLLVVIYVAATFVFYREYWTITMPVNAAIYLPVARIAEALQSIYLPLLAGLILTSWLFLGSHFRHHAAAIAFAASIGFWVAFVVQGKLWPYQVYPAIALGLIGAVLAILDRTEAGTAEMGMRRLLSLAVHPMVAVAFTTAVCAPLFFAHLHYSRLAEAITRIHPQPSIAVISGDIALGHPTTRMVNGRWAMTQWALWVETYVMHLHRMYGEDVISQKWSAIEAIEKADMETFLLDLRRARPDILLTFRIERPLQNRVRKFPGIAEELDRYELVDTVMLASTTEYAVDILRRRPDPSPTTAPHL